MAKKTEPPETEWQKSLRLFRETLSERNNAFTAALHIHASLACFHTAHLDITLVEHYGMDLDALAVEYDWSVRRHKLTFSILRKEDAIVAVEFGDDLSEFSRKELHDIADNQKGLLAEAAERDAQG